LPSNHAFLDGNKRISLALTDTFLRINGSALQLESIAAHKFITESIAKRDYRVRRIREWFATYVKPLENTCAGLMRVGCPAAIDSGSQYHFLRVLSRAISADTFVR
jgi:hypothetical protein